MYERKGNLAQAMVHYHWDLIDELLIVLSDVFTEQFLEMPEQVFTDHKYNVQAFRDLLGFL